MYIDLRVLSCEPLKALLRASEGILASLSRASEGLLRVLSCEPLKTLLRESERFLANL